MKFLNIFFLFALIIPLIANAQNSDYYDANSIKYDDFVYSDNIKSVKLTKLGFELSMPIIELNSNDKLRLRFDDLSRNEKTYAYSIVLCDVNWLPTDLMEMEYVEGITPNYINDYQYSYNTTTKFIHYNLEFPNEDFKIKKSGNYLLKVFEADNPDSLIITRRFYVYENKATISAEVIHSRKPMYRNIKQELLIDVNTQGLNMNNIYQDFNLLVMQNGRKDNMIKKTEASSFSNNIVSYKNIGDIEFNGGNEFRNFDIRNLKINTDRIRTISYDRDSYQVFLLEDLSRQKLNYRFYQDLNGSYSIINKENTHISYDLEADYANVHFSLQSKFPFPDGSVYIIGEFNNWNLNKAVQMDYNPALQAYEKSILLKQGFYDYQYLFKTNDGETLIYKFEGSHSETENVYHIFVYYRFQGEYYDRLIGLKTVESQ